MLRVLSVDEINLIAGGFEDGGFVDDSVGFADDSSVDGGGGGGGDYGGDYGGDFGGGDGGFVDSGGDWSSGDGEGNKNGPTGHGPEDPVPGYPTSWGDMTASEKVCYTAYGLAFPPEDGATGSKTADMACHANMSGENPNATYKLNPQGK